MLKTFIAKITGREIKKNKGGPNPVRLLQAEVTSRDDVQTIELLRQAGTDSNPPDGSRIFCLSIGTAWKIAFAVDDNTPIDSTLNPGDWQIYGSDNGIRTSKITCRADGSIDITTTSAVNVAGDVIADGISLKEHYHQGNLGTPTSASLMTGGGTAPTTPPSTNDSGDIIDGGGTNLSTHTHSQGNDSNGDSEVDTSAPL